MGIKRVRISNDINNKPLNNEKALIALAKHHGLYEGKQIRVKKLAEQLGLRVIEKEMDSEVSGSLSKDNTGIWEISVNSKHHKNRKKYTIAHELGHYIKHKDCSDHFSDTTFFRNQSSGSMEYAANEFAANLLMPEEEFKQVLREYGDDIETIADIFGVSVLAVKFRVSSLRKR
ncbi:ImmA/IrrE family metallo-endopeptidase [Seleniivibrio woodruffii]|uniref:ImmA/IrrE family metallo-endopeptidase n=1 Tax=Seleniivibrio woodruffii TaxID=1078050 RepID=UPI002409B74B|nr:ImmA/IrrE family metallo-endopeptidase [Seleniivibrio woodruffii]